MNAALLIVVVIYETNFEDSATLQSLIKLQILAPGLPDILVYDNSIQNKYNEKFSANVAYYKHDPANNGVGGAYNYAAKFGAGLHKQWLILLDQDTDVSPDYFAEFYKALKKFPAEKLFCPTVRANSKIISPVYYFAYRAFGYSKPKTGLLKSRDYTIINSGLAIKLSSLEELGGYDNDLLLDYSDHYFFSKYKKRNQYFVAIDCVNVHSLSANSDNTFEVAHKRFKKFCISSIIYAKKVNSYSPLVWLFFRTLKLTLKFSTIEFFKFLLFKK
jgi:hypothetical protein